ncbi:unnamed protein product [Ostreobium quekettii]|uniref:Uncharacterized protein n=1 Tax=Ostreobium quekettii TaxID=121088 RepID=A0A8S1IQB3_9CHLO|nr:unnamed protein product [Ostreobium quekettii]
MGNLDGVHDRRESFGFSCTGWLATPRERGWPLADALSSVGLSFKSPELERRYCEGRTESLFLFVDRLSVVMRLGVPAVGVAMQLRRWRDGEAGPPGATETTIMVICMAIMMLQVTLAHSRGAWALRMRGPATVFTRGA